MLNKYIIILFFSQVIYGYSIFDHTQDFKIPSASYIGSNNFVKNLYNFSNPACNQNNHDLIYSSFGNHFNGILKDQQLFFSVKNNLLGKLHLAFLRTSIDKNHNTSSAWNDENQNDIVDFNEIDYTQISFFSDKNLGLIISKPFNIKNVSLGINSKFSVSSILSEKSFSHAFDLGYLYSYSSSSNFFEGTLKFLPVKLDANFGLVIKDIMAYSHWSTGQIEKGETSLVLGSVFNFKLSKEPSSNRNLYFSSDFNIINSKYSIGCEYQIHMENKLLSIQVEDSDSKNSISFLIQLNNKIDISYSFILSKNNELETSQKIILGLNPDIFK